MYSSSCSRLNHKGVRLQWQDVLFEGCKAERQASERTDQYFYLGGGAVINLADKEPVTLDGVTFKSCESAGSSGGLYASCSLTLVNSRFEKCSASNVNYAAVSANQEHYYGRAGALRWKSVWEEVGATIDQASPTKGQDGLAVLVMNSTDFVECTATNAGGAIDFYPALNKAASSGTSGAMQVRFNDVNFVRNSVVNVNDESNYAVGGAVQMWNNVDSGTTVSDLRHTYFMTNVNFQDNAVICEFSQNAFPTTFKVCGGGAIGMFGATPNDDTSKTCYPSCTVPTSQLIMVGGTFSGNNVTIDANGGRAQAFGGALLGWSYEVYQNLVGVLFERNNAICTNGAVCQGGAY
jgi:hypothetical protein